MRSIRIMSRPLLRISGTSWARFFSIKQQLHFWQTKQGYNNQKPETSTKVIPIEKT